MATKLRGKPPAEVAPKHSKLLVYGGPGSGKTWFALSFPGVYYIATEPSAELAHYAQRLKRSGGALFGPDDGACDFDAIASEIRTLSSERHEYRTLVIDSLSKVWHATIGKKQEELGDKDAFGASKKPAIAGCRRILSRLPTLNMNVVFVAHEVALWAGEGKDRKQVGFGPDVWEKIPYELDLTLRIEKHKQGYRTATVDKSRLLGFPEFDRFDLQQSGSDVGYANFATRYGKDFIEKPAVPVVFATPEQVAEIERLLAVVKIDESEIEKWLTKANAESWAELTDEQATKVIAALKAKIGGA